jgi:hypothetical protein
MQGHGIRIEINRDFDWAVTVSANLSLVYSHSYSTLSDSGEPSTRGQIDVDLSYGEHRGLYQQCPSLSLG